MMTAPFRVSVVLPVRNEVRFIDATIQSLLAQRTQDFDLEILAVDGRSEDGTAEKLAAWSTRDPRVRALDNPVGTTPAAMNIGLREASGEFVCIFGAHATYSPDYIATCLRELQARGAVGCSGRVVTRPGGRSLGARLVAWCMAHPFGSSSGSVRTRSSGFVDHLPFPVFAKQPLLDVGGFDETLLRNQDNDMSQKLRALGGRLYLTGEVEATYVAREGLARFVRYAFAGGRWNAASLRRNSRSMGVHHFVPLAFVLTLGGALAAATIAGAAGAPGRPWLLLTFGVLGLHLLIGALAGIQVALRERTPSALWLPGVFLLFHSVYGVGTLWGLFATTPETDVTRPSRRTTAWMLIVGFLGMFHMLPAHAAYLGLEEIPTESSLYVALEALATRYGTPLGFLQTRPWTLRHAKAFLDGLIESGCECSDDPAFVRIRREVDPDAAFQPPALRIAADTRVVEVSPYLRLAYAQDDTRSPSVVRDYRAGGAVAAAVTKNLIVFADYYAATYSPGPHGNPIGGTDFSVVEGYQFNTWFDRAFIAWDGGVVSARAGHTWLRWGPGRSGTLGLYDGSLALDLVETRWQVLPKVQLTWFVAWLDALNEHYLAGHRLDLRLSPAWNVGFSELVRFNGSSQVPQYLIPVVFYNFREKQISRFSDASADSQQTFSKNNVMWTADAVWRVRPGLQLYGEVVVDDISFSSQYRPTEIGYQAGARVAHRLGARDAAGAVLEFTRIYNYTYSTWHRHDFENDGFPLAYPRGPDVEVILTELEWDRGPEWTVTWTALRARKGEGRVGLPWIPEQGKVDPRSLSGTVERTWSTSVSVAYRTGRRLQADAQAGWTSILNAQHHGARSINGWSASSALTVRW